MAKTKGQPGVQHRHIYTRASYLYQAAAFLTQTSLQPPQSCRTSNSTRAKEFSGSTAAAYENGPVKGEEEKKEEKKEEKAPSTKEPVATAPPSATAATEDQRRQALQNMSRHLLADMRAISLKVLIRQRPEVKRTVCRYCDALLVEGGSCDAVVENASRGGRKPWADVLVVRCRTCGGAKRFPVNVPAKKQVRRSLREEGKRGSGKRRMGGGKSKEKKGQVLP